MFACFFCLILGSMDITAEDIIQDVATQTPQDLSQNSPRKRFLKSKIRSLKRRCTSLEASGSTEEIVDLDVFFARCCDTFFTSSVANFVKMQYKLSKVSLKGSRYTNEMKQFALTIYFLAPKVYRFLRTTFRLPSVSTLLRVTRKWQIRTGLTDFVLGVIRRKVQTLADDARNCIICADEMTLKTNLFYNRGSDYISGFCATNAKRSYTPARNVLVVMVRGINYNWKQQVSYYLVDSSCTAEDLQNIIFECIEKLSSCGLNILAMISDQGSNFIKFTNNLQISAKKPYFLVNGRQIFYLFDVPHLLKSTRNNFLTYNFKIGDSYTDIKYLQEFYAKDKSKSYRLAPKLTDDHLHPSSFKKMKVKLAAQLFSNTVVTALSTYIDLGVISQTAETTVDFIAKMDKLFDVFNSNKLVTPKKYNLPFNGSDHQINFLADMSNLFLQMRVENKERKDVTSTLKFINGWRISISALLQIWELLQSQGISKIFTRRFNQDCLENFFGKIRQQSGNNMNPTTVQFAASFKKLFCLNYFHQSEGTNCIEDFDELLTLLPTNDEAQDYNWDIAIEGNMPVNFQSLDVTSTDYIELDLEHKNAFSYVCGYLIKKCLDKHTCDVCLEYAQETKILNETNIYCHFRAYENINMDTFGKLQMPNETFIDFVHNLEIKFCYVFPKLAVYENVGFALKEEMKELSNNFKHPCENFQIYYLLSLFVRVRIFYTLKFKNREFKEMKRGKQSQKLTNLLHM